MSILYIIEYFERGFVVTIEYAVEVVKKYEFTNMTHDQYMEYMYAQCKLIRAIVSGNYILVETDRGD